MKLKKAVFLLAAGILLFCASLPAYAEEAQSKGLESYFRTGDHKPYGSTAQLLRQALSNHPSGRKP